MISDCAREHVTFTVAYGGGLTLISYYLHPITILITHDAGTEIIVGPLTLIFRMGQGACLSWI
jgi:hypothetical protein